MGNTNPNPRLSSGWKSFPTEETKQTHLDPKGNWESRERDKNSGKAGTTSLHSPQSRATYPKILRNRTSRKPARLCHHRPHIRGDDGADPAFPATLPCRKLGTSLPSVFPSGVIPEIPAPQHPSPCSVPAPLCSQCIPVIPFTPLPFVQGEVEKTKNSITLR